MGQITAQYYQTRAEELNLDGPPPILDGEIRGPFPLNKSAAEIALLMATTEKFALDGLRGVFGAHGQEPSDEEWQHIRAAPVDVKVKKVPAFAQDLVSKLNESLQVASLPDRVTLRAVARTLLPEPLLRRAWVLTRRLRNENPPLDQNSQVYYLSRLTDAADRTLAGHLTVQRARYIAPSVRGNHKKAALESLSVQYLGVTLLASELHLLQVDS
jgi:hypothetical protein